MKVLFLTLAGENIASSRTRVFQYIPYLLANGIKSKIIINDPYYAQRSKILIIKILQSIHKKINNIWFLFFSFFFKNIFIQKVYLPCWEIRLFRFLSKNIIYDFDDAIYVTDQNQNISKRNLKRLNYTLSKANWVIVENDNNANYARKCGNSNTLIITGPIECNRYTPQNKSSHENIIVIGWIGSPSTTKYLEIVRKPLQNMALKYTNIKLLLIGATPFNIEGLDVEIYPWTLNTEVELLSKFDIGIMPLYNDIWCAGKGGYKLLQYMAMGIPSIATPVGINDIILNMGKIGFKANTYEEWIYSFETLINNKDLRIQMGKKAREIALTHFSYERFTKDLMNSFI